MRYSKYYTDVTLACQGIKGSNADGWMISKLSHLKHLIDETLYPDTRER